MAGYGKVATAAMLPILSYFGHPTYNLPTALVSNTLDYGKFNLLDTTDYIKGVFPVWKELGFTFDAKIKLFKLYCANFLQKKERL